MQKKWMGKILALMLVLACVMGLTACGGKSKAVGKYDLESMETEGMTINVQDMLNTLSESGVEMNVKILLDLKEDGTFTLDMAALDESESEEGKWEEKDGIVTLSAEDGESIDATLEGDTLTLEADGQKMVFKKQ